MTPTETPFAGIDDLAPGDPLSSNGFKFQGVDRETIDRLLRIGAVTHRHDGHAAMADPTTAPTISASPTGGVIPAGLPVALTYTLTDPDGGQTLPAPIATLTTLAGFDDPTLAPIGVADNSAGTLLAGNWDYAISVADGAGGETAIGPSVTVVILPGFANGQAHISGLAAATLSASGGAGGASWRLWRSQGGGLRYLIATGTVDTFLDNGVAGDCTVAPPEVGTTVGANLLSATVHSAGQPPAAAFFNIYATIDGAFNSPSLLGTFAVAQYDIPQTFTDLTVTAGAPPTRSQSFPGANQIDPDTDIANFPWKSAVANLAALPSMGNTDGDVRETLDTHTIYTWHNGSSTWVPVGGGGGGGGAGWVLLTDHGVTPDGQYLFHGAVTAGTPDLIDTFDHPFVPGDVGKLVAVQSALSTATDHSTLVGTIASYVSASHVTMSVNADQTASGLNYVFGTDNLTPANAYLGTPRDEKVFAQQGLYLSSGTLTVLGNELYGVRDQTKFIVCNSFNADTFHLGGGTSGSAAIVDVVPCTVLNWGTAIGATPPLPTNGWAVKTVATGFPSVQPRLRIDISDQNLFDGMPMPPWSGVNIDQIFAEVDVDGSITTQGGSCGYINPGSNPQHRVTWRASYYNNSEIGTSNYDIVVVNAYHTLIDGARPNGNGQGKGLLIVGPFIERLRVRHGEFSGLAFAAAGGFFADNLHFDDCDFGNTGASNGSGAVIDPGGGNTLTGVRMTNCIIGGNGLIINGGTRIRINGCDVRSTGSGADRGKIKVAAGVSHFRLTDNDVTLGITVAAGASDYYVIRGNDSTGVAVTDGGTGTHKDVSGNI